MNKFFSTLLAGALGGLIVFGAGKLTNGNAKHVVVPESAPVARQTNYTYGGGPVAFDFTRAAERSMPAVVHIKATESRQNAIDRQRQNPWSGLFGDNFNQRSGTGSGVIYSSDGYIMTNNHVIEFADEYEVTLHDNREFKARLVGRDANTDMAVIKIDATDLPAIELGNSDDVKVGQWAVAVGNPFDLASTVTAGIISAKARNIDIIQGSTALESFIQTDAAVNPGNSGGALTDIDGRLIGINSAIASPNGTFAGYAFAIPINLAKKIADDLIKYGEFKRAYLGVEIFELNPQRARELEVGITQGIVVQKAAPDGSAAAAKIVEGDIITKINGKTVTSVPELREMIGRSKIGETVSVTIYRTGKYMDVPVRLKTRSEN